MRLRLDLEIALLALIAIGGLGAAVVGRGYPPIPSLLPQVAGALTFVITVRHLVGLLRGKGTRNESADAKDDAKEDTDKGHPAKGALRWYHVSAITFLYAGGIYVVGFPVTTFLFVAIVPRLLGARASLVASGGVGLVVSLVFAALMKWVFQMPIPMGMLWPR